MSLMNGTTGVHGDDYQHWAEGPVGQVRSSSPQPQAQTQRQVSDVYSNTLPVRKPAPAKSKASVGKPTSPRKARFGSFQSYLIKSWEKK